MARANNWITNAEKVQQLTLALEGPAADTLKEIDETSSTAYNDIWASLKSRFGGLDEPRDAMRRFENRMSVCCFSVTHDVRQSHDVRLSVRDRRCPSVRHDVRLSVYHT